MREENLRRMLIADRWDNVGDPLLLNINIALAHGAFYRLTHGLITPTRLGLTYRVCDNPFNPGAHLLGATSVAEQYYERARKHLANLFDTSSYAVAEAMFSMGYYVYAQVSHRASALTTHVVCSQT
jgi:hypothetical protein